MKIFGENRSVLKKKDNPNKIQGLAAQKIAFTSQKVDGEQFKARMSQKIDSFIAQVEKEKDSSGPVKLAFDQPPPTGSQLDEQKTKALRELAGKSLEISSPALSKRSLKQVNEALKDVKTPEDLLNVISRIPADKPFEIKETGLSKSYMKLVDNANSKLSKIVGSKANTGNVKPEQKSKLVDSIEKTLKRLQTDIQRLPDTQIVLPEVKVTALDKNFLIASLTAVLDGKPYNSGEIATNEKYNKDLPVTLIKQASPRSGVRVINPVEVQLFKPTCDYKA